MNVNAQTQHSLATFTTCIDSIYILLNLFTYGTINKPSVFLIQILVHIIWERLARVCVCVHMVCEVRIGKINRSI